VSDAFRITERGEYTCIQVRLQPRASRNGFAGVTGDSLKIRLTSPPIDDRANRQLIEFLSEELDFPASRIALLSGQKSRSKVVGFKGISKEELSLALHNILYN